MAANNMEKKKLQKNLRANLKRDKIGIKQFFSSSFAFYQLNPGIDCHSLSISSFKISIVFSVCKGRHLFLFHVHSLLLNNVRDLELQIKKQKNVARYYKFAEFHKLWSKSWSVSILRPNHMPINYPSTFWVNFPISEFKLTVKNIK